MPEIKLTGVTDEDYDNRAAFAESAQGFYGESKRRSEAFFAANKFQRDSVYGPKPRNRIDFLLVDADAPTLFHIHGGYWQWNDKEDYAFIGETAMALGMNFALVEHTHAPDATMDGIVGEVRAGLGWLRDNLNALGVRNEEIVVTGHSSGGHLCASMRGEPGVIGIVPVSGVFDLRPISQIYLNDVVGMDADEVQRNSPLLNPLTPVGFAIIAYGEGELESFGVQSACYVAAVESAGGTAQLLPCMDRDHFTVLYELVEPDGKIFQALSAALGR